MLEHVVEGDDVERSVNRNGVRKESWNYFEAVSLSLSSDNWVRFETDCLIPTPQGFLQEPTVTASYVKKCRLRALGQMRQTVQYRRAVESPEVLECVTSIGLINRTL